MPEVMTEALRKAEHEMVVCNACRYCEAYCPVFQAMEQRVIFSRGDLTYLANLCHNCGECLYACQYAPPHEFNIDVPRTLSKVRIESYEASAWPSFAGVAFRRPWLVTAVTLAISLYLMIVVSAQRFAGATPRQMSDLIFGLIEHPGEFYRVIPHHTLVGIFGTVALFVVGLLAIGHRRFNEAVGPGMPGRQGPGRERGVADVLTLRHLHATGTDCVDAEETRRPWRRWLHHCTFYGFALCFASTTVAAIYHLVFGWIAPYSYTSVPVILGTIGGLGLLIGPAGLFVVDAQRDRALAHSAERAIDRPFLLMLFMTSLTGLLLLAFRESSQMPFLLVLHLGVVLAFFVTLPYGKFVHGLYRGAALVKFRREEQSQ